MIEQQQGNRDVTIVNNARCVMERPQVVASLVLSGNAYRKPKVTRYDLSPMLDTVPAANLPQSNGDPSFGPLLRFFASKYFVNAKGTFDGIILRLLENKEVNDINVSFENAINHLIAYGFITEDQVGKAHVVHDARRCERATMSER